MLPYPYIAYMDPMGTDTEFVKIETLFPKCAIFTAPIAHDLEATMQAEWVSHGIPRK